tara:strand:- start:237 stop:341 length:105 start_codon:yes stop_codon:yes gene_type:complete
MAKSKEQQEKEIQALQALVKRIEEDHAEWEGEEE